MAVIVATSMTSFGHCAVIAMGYDPESHGWLMITAEPSGLIV